MGSRKTRRWYKHNGGMMENDLRVLWRKMMEAGTAYNAACFYYSHAKNLTPEAMAALKADVLDTRHDFHKAEIAWWNASRIGEV